jgi:tetratricopeptide (TPR) repeat protein
MQVRVILSKKTAAIILVFIALAILVILYRPSNLEPIPNLGYQKKLDWTLLWEKINSLGPIFTGNGFTIAGIIGFAISAITITWRIMDKRQEKKEKRQQVLEKFTVFFEEGASVLSQYHDCTLTESARRGGPVDPKLLVAKGWDALRDSTQRIESMIKTHIKSESSFHIIHVHAGSKQGRSVFLWRLVRDLIEDRTKDRMRAEFWILKNDKTFESKQMWVNLISATKSFIEISKSKNITLFLEDPFRKFKATAKSQPLDSEVNFWRAFQREFANFSKLTVVAISSFWRMLQDEENAQNMSLFGLSLTRNDVTNILGGYAKLRGWKELEKEVSVFLSQPGILEKCAGNISYLLYRLELFHIGPVGKIHSILGSDTESLVEKYEEWEDNDPKKRILLFVAYVNLLGLPAPDWLFLDVKKRDWDALVMDFLDCNAAKEWELKIPFLPHILLEEKIDRIKSEDASYEHLSGFFIDLLSKWIGRSCDLLSSRDEKLSIEASDFIRNLVHFTAEEKYRPVLTFSGYKIAQSLFKERMKEIREFVENTLIPMMNEDNSTVAHNRRWASTFATFGLIEKADELYQHILKELPNLKPDKKIRIMIPLAKGLAEIHIDEAVKIYHNLLFDPEYAQSKSIQRKALLTSAVDVLLWNNKAPIAIEWMEKLRNYIEWDSLLWLKEGSVREELGGEENLKKAEECFRKAIDESERASHHNRKTKLNSLHRYAIFLIRNETSLPDFGERPIVDSLLNEAEKIAVALKENVEGIHSARAEYLQKKGEHVKALEQYRKAVHWCRIEGIPNSRPYNQLANFLLENSVKLSETEQVRSQYLEEAERCLTEILLQSGQLYGRSRRSLFSILGRLVGGTVSREDGTQVPYHYQFHGKERPDYDEALTLLDEAFESNSHDRFDPHKKTFQDVRVHAQVKDVLINKSMKMPSKEERCRYFKEAQEHFKAAFEGFPQLGSSSREKEKWHTIRAMDAYAGFIWQRLEDQDCLDKKEGNDQADKCYEEAETRLKEWGLDSKHYDKAYDIHSHRVIFLFQSGKIPRLKRASPPGTPESDIPGVPIIPLLDARDSAVKAASSSERALEVLSPLRVDYEKCFRLSVSYLLLVVRALVRDSDHYPNNEKETSRWIQKYVEVAERLLNEAKGLKPSICAEISKEINRFMNDKYLARCWSENSYLRTRLANLCLAYGYPN